MMWTEMQILREGHYSISIILILSKYITIYILGIPMIVKADKKLSNV